MPQIALLATGDEVVEGEVLNSNGQLIAQYLTDFGYQIGRHLTCRDQQSEIESCIRALLITHQVVIITGGLGPTADDRTRYAVAEVLEKPLIFDKPSWQAIEQLYQLRNIEVPSTNQQQAYFPEGAQILVNDNGTANGCYLMNNEKLIIMLPGPPNECLPILHQQLNQILPSLIAPKFNKLHKWRVFGISESLLAQEINTRFPEHCQEIGFRWVYPYIDIKYRPKTDNEVIIDDLEHYLGPMQICQVDSNATTELASWLKAQPSRIIVDDEVTGGLLELGLASPDLYQKLSFNNHLTEADYHVTISGLKEYWLQHKTTPQTTIEITITQAEKRLFEKQYLIDNKPINLPKYACEFIAYQLKQALVAIKEA